MSKRPAALALAVVVAMSHSARAQATGEPWQIVPQPQTSLVFARDGALVGEIGRESRTSVSIRTLPKYVGQAFVAGEARHRLPAGRGQR